LVVQALVAMVAQDLELVVRRALVLEEVLKLVLELEQAPD
jgi:hypothetical protein